MTLAGVAFTWVEAGDMRSDPDARRREAGRLGIPDSWATARQVHGATAKVVEGPGDAGEADALVTVVPNLPVAVFVADCLGVVMVGPGTVGVAHAGWRGLAAGVLESTIEAMSDHGRPPEAAAIGPGIGPCCFEVGPEVAALFPGHVSETTWGTTSVDLIGATVARLGEALDVEVDGRCTACGGGLSHRRDGSQGRQAAIGWVP